MCNVQVTGKKNVRAEIVIQTTSSTLDRLMQNPFMINVNNGGKNEQKKATHRSNPFLTTTTLPCPVEVSQFRTALLVWTGDLARQLPGRQKMIHPFHLQFR